MRCHISCPLHRSRQPCVPVFTACVRCHVFTAGVHCMWQCSLLMAQKVKHFSGLIPDQVAALSRLISPFGDSLHLITYWCYDTRTWHRFLNWKHIEGSPQCNCIAGQLFLLLDSTSLTLQGVWQNSSKTICTQISISESEFLETWHKIICVRNALKRKK